MSRKIEFDKTEALDAAMQVFWKKGFSGASLSELTQSMGINKPSLYSAFGNKEALFVQATQYYLESVAKRHTKLLVQDGSNLRTRLGAYLRSVIAGQCNDDGPRGCYISLCLSETEGDALPEAAQSSLNEAGRHSHTALMALFQRDTESKAKGYDQRAALNTRFIMTFLSGTAAMARSGQTESDLLSLTDIALDGLGITA